MNAGLPGIAAFDLAALRVPIGRSGRTLRIWCAGLRSMKLRSIKLSPGIGKDEAVTAKASRLVKRGTPEALLAGRQIQTAKLTNPYWEATFAEPRQFDSILIKAGKNFDITRLYTLKIEIDGELVYDNVGAERAGQKVGNFLVRAGEYVTAATKTRRGLAPSAKAFQKQAGVLATAMRAALAAPEEADIEALDAARLRCIEKLVASLKLVRGAEVKDVFTAAKPALSFLVTRGQPKATTKTLTIETDAAAMLLSILLINSSRKKVTNHILRGFWMHFWSSEQLAALERRVNNVVKRAMRKRANAPYQVRVHGLSGPHLRANATAYLDNMAALQTALTELGYDSFLAYGTLLGAVRDHDFIEHDDDVDMAVVLKSPAAKAEMTALCIELRDRGFKTTVFRSPPLLDVRNARGKCSIDLFPVVPMEDGRMQMYMEKMRVRPVNAELVVPVGTVEFLGRTFNAPASPTGFLADRYGDSWQTPLRKVAHMMISD